MLFVLIFNAFLNEKGTFPFYPSQAYDIISSDRLKNKFRYFEAGTAEQLSASCKRLQEDIEVEVGYIFGASCSLFMSTSNSDFGVNYYFLTFINLVLPFSLF